MKKTFFELAAKGAGLVGLTAMLTACGASLGGIRNGEDSVRINPNGTITATDNDRKTGRNEVNIKPNGQLCASIGQTKIKLSGLCIGTPTATAGKKPAPGAGTTP